MTAKFKLKGSVILLRMFQHCLHARRMVRRLERLNSEQGEGGIEPNPLALRDRVVSLVLQSTVFPHGGNTTFAIPLSFYTVRITGDVDRVNRIIHCDRDLDSRSFTEIRRAKTLLLDGLINGSHGVADVRRVTAMTMSLTPDASSSMCRAGHRVGDIG